MSTYKNTNLEDVQIPTGQRLSAGGTIALYEVIAPGDLPAGIIKIADGPIWNPTILSDQYSGDAGSVDITIPATANSEDVENFILNIYCSAGQVGIKFNDASFTPELILYANEGCKDVIMRDRITKIILTYKMIGSVAKVDLRRS